MDNSLSSGENSGAERRFLVFAMQCGWKRGSWNENRSLIGSVAVHRKTLSSDGGERKLARNVFAKNIKKISKKDLVLMEIWSSP